MKRLVALLLLYASVCLGHAGDAQKAIEQANAAAHRDDHAAAIKAYQQAIAMDPSVREAVIVKLGLQYLWADLPVEASRLLSEYVNKHPEDCSVTPNYARALAWSNQLRQARSLYQNIQRDCPEIAVDAMLGEARTLRWMDRNSTAARVYREAAEKGTASQQQDAQLGMALT